MAFETTLKTPMPGTWTHLWKKQGKQPSKKPCGPLLGYCKYWKNNHLEFREDENECSLNQSVPTCRCSNPNLLLQLSFLWSSWSRIPDHSANTASPEISPLPHNRLTGLLCYYRFPFPFDFTDSPHSLWFYLNEHALSEIWHWRQRNRDGLMPCPQNYTVALE